MESSLRLGPSGPAKIAITTPFINVRLTLSTFFEHVTHVHESRMLLASLQMPAESSVCSGKSTQLQRGPATKQETLKYTRRLL